MDGLPSVEPTAEPVSADGASPEEEAPDALEERISGLPDSEKVLAFRGHVVRLSARVAELEQQLSRHKE
jgi:hypothetical protein